MSALRGSSLIGRAGEGEVQLSEAHSCEPICLARLLALGLQRKPDEPALISTDRRLSFRELDRISSHYAANLLSLGLRRGDRAASLLPNCDAQIIHYLGCLKAGFVAVPMNYRYTPPEIDRALATSEAEVLLAHVERSADIATTRLAGRLPLGVIDCGAKDGGRLTFEALLEGPVGQIELPAPAPTDPAFIFFTSGSTGPAKGVTHSCESLGWIITRFVEGCAVTASDLILPALSLSHIGGFMDAFMGLAAGAGIVIPRKLDGRELLRLLREHQPTILTSLPATLMGLLREHDRSNDDFASIRLVLAGGDKVPIELTREFLAVSGVQINELYGMSEIGCPTINPIGGVNKIGSVGRLIAGYQMSIRDERGNELPTDNAGRLWIKSACTMTGYWGNPEATMEVIREGWLDTGDVMKVDGDGYLWFCGRRKQIIVHDGSNISPQEVEDALIEHPAVASAGVVGIPDVVHGENVRAYVTLKQGIARPTLQELIDFARARVGYKAPEEVCMLDQMPINATGKVDRVLLKKMAEERLPEGETG